LYDGFNRNEAEQMCSLHVYQQQQYIWQFQVVESSSQSDRTASSTEQQQK
jgi:hypothetical protein